MSLLTPTKSKPVHSLSNPWPSDAPCKCPKCNSDFDSRINLSYGKYGFELLRKMAWWAPLPSFPFALWFCMENPDRSFIMAVMVLTILPSIFLNLIYAVCPTKRRIKCWKCGFTHLDDVKRHKVS
ncbi:hypothetical protein Rhal01_01279 [Rubritalea halochordaticola]|uniref:LITAF domain-containing protein n=1 Tax=Rubritalea halochordaticola TaxID=714537 RepID=A0ABP9V1C6_9BACT